MKHFLSILSLFLAFAASAQTSTSAWQPGVTSEGAVYFLPKTAIRVSVLVEKTTYTPGEFARYAGVNLRLENVEQSAKTTHRVISVTQTPVAVADTSKVFAVKYAAGTSAPLVNLSPEGVLLAINTDPKPLAEAKPFVPARKPQADDPRQYLTQEILLSGSPSKMASLIANEIYDLRENRSLLVKGQADFMPKDGQQLKLMLNQLDRQDRALTSLFAGTVVRDTTEEIIIVTPDTPVKREVLFRISKQLGMVDADDLAGEPYYVSVENLQALPPTAPEADKKKKKAENGIYVNVPGRMRVNIYKGVDRIGTADYAAPQFGRVDLLSGNLFNKHLTTRLRLNALTGAVEKIDAEQPK